MNQSEIQEMVLKATYRDDLEKNIKGLEKQGFQRRGTIRYYREFGDIYYSQNMTFPVERVNQND